MRPSLLRFLCQEALLSLALFESSLLLGMAQTNPPANDAFAGRELLTGLTNLVVADNTLASSELDEPFPQSCDPAGRSLWWSYTTPEAGWLQVAGTSTNISVVWALYRGESLGELQPVAYSCAAPLLFPVEAGEVFHISLDGASGQSGNVNLWIDLYPRPANDAFANRVRLEGTNVSGLGDNRAATMEPGEPETPGGGPGTTVWYSWTAPITGRVAIDPGALRTWGAYTGTNLEQLVAVRMMPDFLAIAGTEYQIQINEVSSSGQGAGPFEFRIVEYPMSVATNDHFANAILLKGTRVGGWEWASEASTELGEPAHLGGAPCKSLWWRWQAPQHGTWTLRASYSLLPEVVLAVYTGSSVDALTLVGKGTNEVIGVPVIGGVTYYIAGVVAEDALGDVYFYTGSLIVSYPSRPVPGNLLLDPSFEGTSLLLTNWHPERGVWEFIGADFLDLPSLSSKLWAPADEITTFLKSQLSESTLVALTNYQGTGSDATLLLSNLVEDLNRVVTGPSVYDPQRFAGIVLRPETQQLLTQDPQGDELVRLNRLLLEDAYPLEIFSGHQAYGGSVGERGGADGFTWIVLLPRGQLWQYVPTVAGRQYEVRFACNGAGRIKVKWDGQDLGIVEIPPDEGYWHWPTFVATARTNSSRLLFQNIGPAPFTGHVALDGISVVWKNEPPTFVTPPASASVATGGTVAFIAGVSGSDPLSYQWLFNGTVLPGERGRSLTIASVLPTHAGEYVAVVTNVFGAVTSPPAVLVVEAPANPIIVLQPYGDVVPVGGYFALSVAAIGNPPLSYQWVRNGEQIPGATNRQWVLTAAQTTDAGTYAALVWNDSATVWSLPVTLTVSETSTGGATVYFVNFDPPARIDARVVDVDGVTRLSGAGFVAQLYGGPSLDQLRPAGGPSSFLTGVFAGVFRGFTVTLPNVAPMATAVVQVRAWEAGKGASYEEARALGGKFGKSQVFLVTTGGGPPTLPGKMTAMQPFQLQAGLPRFTVGQIDLLEKTEDGLVRWSLRGETGSRYAIERATNSFIWHPLMVITNLTGTAVFSDPNPPPDGGAFYRSRILD